MIHLVTSKNATQYSDLLEEMFVWRHRMFVEQRGWKALARPDGREIDQFDTKDAVYLLALDETEKLTGSFRLVPTHKPYLMSEVFPHLVIKGEPPRSPFVWELTRGFVIPGKRLESGSNPVLEMLFSAMMEWAVDEEIKSIIQLSDLFWLPRWLKVGWKVDPVGLPTLMDGDYFVPSLIEVSEEILSATRRAFNLPNATVFENRAYLKRAS
jgi:acyl-homoserine lactone synthase